MDNILNPNTQNFPYWAPLAGAQSPLLIPGAQLARMVEDVKINRTPEETDFNRGDIRQIPLPTAPGQDVTSAGALLVHSTPMGRGAGVGLFDMLTQSITQTQNQGGENGS